MTPAEYNALADRIEREEWTTELNEAVALAFGYVRYPNEREP